ncbi:MAG: hypothetical protein PUF18_05500 [Methanosphaera sp.]|nr:hypothetical protein [Methanosphaera sp.]MCI5866502.1 hypothetical protein [Methanosphaera sp.]MDD6534947.1 hypothetical protein [Methanosphaera sp.]
MAFLDADDIFIDNDALEKMYNYGCEHDANIVCADLMRVSLDGEIEENFNYKDNNYLKCNEYGSVKSQDYGMPWAFYKNIFKRTYLEEHNIVFPDLARGQDPVFMAEALVNTDKIYTVPTTLYGYNYAANGGANAKVNSYPKKYDYMMHFKMTIDILSRAGFVRSAVKYKNQLITFLSLNRNCDDHELIEIIHDIFEDEDTPYFESHDEELIYLRFMILNHDNAKELYEEYWPIKRHIRKVVRKYDDNILMHPLIVNSYMKLDSQVN